MLCPKCQAEYVEGIIKCPDCDLPLVSDLAAYADSKKKQAEPADAGGLVTVISGELSRVLVAKSLLMDAGIMFFTRNENLFSVYGAMSMGPLEIQVRAADEQEARALLGEL